MRRVDDPKEPIVAAAILGALAESRRRGLDRIPMASASARLRVCSRQLAASPIGRDQILSVALALAADEIEASRRPGTEVLGALGGPAPSQTQRLAERKRAFAGGRPSSAEAVRIAHELERRLRLECAGACALATRLRGEAALHEALWDDPRLACHPSVRLAMLLSVPKLLARADELEAPRASTISHEAIRACEGAARSIS